MKSVKALQIKLQSIIDEGVQSIFCVWIVVHQFSFHFYQSFCQFKMMKSSMSIGRANEIVVNIQKQWSSITCYCCLQYLCRCLSIQFISLLSAILIHPNYGFHIIWLFRTIQKPFGDGIYSGWHSAWCPFRMRYACYQQHRILCAVASTLAPFVNISIYCLRHLIMTLIRYVKEILSLIMHIRLPGRNSIVPLKSMWRYMSELV